MYGYLPDARGRDKMLPGRWVELSGGGGSIHVNVQGLHALVTGSVRGIGRGHDHRAGRVGAEDAADLLGWSVGLNYPNSLPNPRKVTKDPENLSAKVARGSDEGLVKFVIEPNEP
jgi:hypothetical protein